jgi:transcriptional regulator with XRE-family HTH domain
LEEIGARIKSARMQLGYSRKKFAEKFHFASATIQAWEDGKYTVPVKSLLKYIHALDEAGLVSSVDWFIHGVGISPRPKFSEQSIETNASRYHSSASNPIINDEIGFIEQSTQNSIIVSITDDTMQPFFNIGDFVGGCFLSEESIEKHIGSFCIIIIDTGEILVRKLKNGTKAGCFTLVSTNLDTEVSTAFLTNCDVQKIAPVTWHRKAFTIQNINR